MKISRLGSVLLTLASATARAAVEISPPHKQLEHGYYTEPTATRKFTNESETSNEDHLRRLFLTKLSIGEAQKANPDAILSINSPFTLMTDDDFGDFVGSSVNDNSFDTMLNGDISTVTGMEEQHERSLESLPASVDWSTSSHCVAPVKGQHHCGACYAFAALGSLESAYCLKTGNLELFSEQQAVNCNTRTYSCHHGSPLYALDYVGRHHGVCTEAAYPYTSGETGQVGQCKSVSCSRVNVSIKHIVVTDASERGLVTALAKTPVAVSVAANN